MATIQRLTRSLPTTRKQVVQVPRISRLTVSNPATASQHDHLRTVHHTLQSAGVLQIQLGFPDDESTYLHKLLLNLHQHHGHGLPITHSANRGWMWDIRPSPESFQSNNTQARSETMEEFPWHTDCSYESSPPQYFALQVLQPDRCGGGTLSVLNVDELLTLLSPSTLETLFSPNFQITVPPEFVKSQADTQIVGGLLAISPETNAIKLRFREDIVVPLTNQASEALAELKSVLLGPAAHSRILNLRAKNLPRGSIILMDNGRWLHARNEVKDPDRHLRRVRWDARQFARPSAAHLGL
ncbi:hypothetical protein DTO013E5_342 [Penicillium roqueforti]|uniref:uncharacterized protein n=1 Tax=Penicillium roqueforti TaxID=5082 RepID=UPI00190CFF15|nr:uncharacterized protein LCP9604111_797 [Penicillium roqueforti]KAF9253271.1 hypothetical protein LCP9604111_797 [Penicillium roqueforti]KAI1838786.1 hypothetical protein CBS147337_511 [Penicillium roqueforti]KAI2680327.1 hypothetical protein CBS147355_3307 [Penicillium roqueforti]KAI2691284.1 hypothetical protein LCP963914a_1485 [Penicillium roqueforti]KAI2706720.1 hypothetical protein CBS147372_631 [Penicillium roqueforti]